MTTYMTVCTDIDGIRQEFADALGLDDEWQVPPDIELEIWVEHDRYEWYGEEHTWQSVWKAFYEGKELGMSGALHRYLCDQLEKESRHNPAL